MTLNPLLEEIIENFSEKLPQFIGANDIGALYSKISLISGQLISDAVVAGPITKTGDILTSTVPGNTLVVGGSVALPTNALTVKSYVSISSPVYSGTGLNDFIVSGFPVDAAATYEIVIDGLNVLGIADTFTYRKNGGAWNPGNFCFATPIDGLTFDFTGGGLGHQLGDSWSFTSSGKQPFQILDTTDAPILSVIDIGGGLTTGAVECSGTLRTNTIEPYAGGSDVKVNSVDFITEIAGGNSIGNANKVSSLYLYTKISPIINVMAWGAVGDGTAVDNGAIGNAFNAALPGAAGYNESGIVVYLPPGTYKFTSIISKIPSSAGSITIKGAGSQNTKIIATNLTSAHAVLEFQGPIYSFELSGVTIQASYQAPYTGYGVGITNTSATILSSVKLSDVVIKGGLANPIYLKGGMNVVIDNCDFTGSLDPVASGLFMWSNDKPVNMVINNTYFRSTLYGLKIRQNTKIVANNCFFENCTTGVYSEDMTAAIDPQFILNQCKFSGCTADVNLQAPLSRAVMTRYLTDGSGLAKLNQPNLVAISDAKSLAIKKIAVTKTFTNFVPVPDGLTSDIEIFSLPAGASIKDVYANVTTKFLGGAIGAYSISVGKTAAVTKYMAANDVFTAPVALTGAAAKGVGLTTPGLTNVEDFSSATSIRAYATAVGANLGAATQGSITFYIVYEESYTV